jgi:hypothetical protein
MRLRWPAGIVSVRRSSKVKCHERNDARRRTACQQKDIIKVQIARKGNWRPQAGGGRSERGEIELKPFDRDHDAFGSSHRRW